MRYIKTFLLSGIFLTSSLLSMQSCADIRGDTNLSSPISQQFSDYWHQGLAELNHYHLEQVRYGEVHKGNAVLIFVTEDFLVDKQVKDEGLNPKNYSIPVLKLNFTRKFNTGIYPYSLMTSVFHPISEMNDKPLKISTSVQDWCGHTYMQLNNKNNRYLVTLNSYFEKEGDQQFEIEDTMLEDDIWLKIRLNPKMLPEGDVRMVPGMQYSRLLHQPYMAQDVYTEIKQIHRPELSPELLLEYRLQYGGISRSLTIIFTQNFPHEILYWEEKTSPLTISGRGESSMVTRATRASSVMLDYWNKNAQADSTYRQVLGLK